MFVLCYNADDGTAHNDTVAVLLHFFGLIWGGYAKTHRIRCGGIFADSLKKCSEIGGELLAHTGYAGGGNAIEEPLAVLGNGFNPLVEVGATRWML